jgi:hypothetical protein
MLEEQYVLDQIEVLRNGTMQIRHATLIIKDGVEIAKTYHRGCISPGDNVDNQDEEVRLIAGVIWTPQKVANFHAEQALAQARNNKSIKK